MPDPVGIVIISLISLSTLVVVSTALAKVAHFSYESYQNSRMKHYINFTAIENRSCFEIILQWISNNYDHRKNSSTYLIGGSDGLILLSYPNEKRSMIKFSTCKSPVYITYLKSNNGTFPKSETLIGFTIEGNDRTSIARFLMMIFSSSFSRNEVIKLAKIVDKTILSV